MTGDYVTLHLQFIWW